MSQALHVYTSHFGLAQEPFTMLPDPEFLYWSERHQRAYAMLEYGLLTHAAITVVTGEIGTGKTTLIRHLLREMPHDLRVGMLPGTRIDPRELLQWILLSLREQVDGTASYPFLFNQLQDLLSKEHATGRRVVLICDEAQNFSGETLEQIRTLSNLNVDKVLALQLVLVGQPELRQTIHRPELVQFSQRIGADFHLERMFPEDVANYVRHRLKVAGADREIFTPHAFEIIAGASHGVPRLINRLCDRSLVYAFADNMSLVDAECVERVLGDQPA